MIANIDVDFNLRVDRDLQLLNDAEKKLRGVYAPAWSPDGSELFYQWKMPARHP